MSTVQVSWFCYICARFLIPSGSEDLLSARWILRNLCRCLCGEGDDHALPLCCALGRSCSFCCSCEHTQAAPGLKMAGRIKNILNNIEDRLEKMLVSNPVHAVFPEQSLLFKVIFEWCTLFWKCPMQSFSVCLTWPVTVLNYPSLYTVFPRVLTGREIAGVKGQNQSLLLHFKHIASSPALRGYEGFIIL